VFNIVAAARDAGTSFVRDAFAAGREIQGWEVDDAVRKVIDDAGYGQFFSHRTGHNIGQEVHGNGAHMDNLETHETRRVMPGTCFSIEPGIYLPEFGIRSEVDVFVGRDGTVHVTGGPQSEVLPILRQY
ncbi:MAG: M24 family metallopeptidase, partial [Planctomycetota bacterium]